MVDYGSHFQAVARRPLCYATGFVGVRPPRQSLHLAGAGGVPRLNSFFQILNKKGIKNSVYFRLYQTPLVHLRGALRGGNRKLHARVCCFKKDLGCGIGQGESCDSLETACYGLSLRLL